MKHKKTISYLTLALYSILVLCFELLVFVLLASYEIPLSGWKVIDWLFLLVSQSVFLLYVVTIFIACMKVRKSEELSFIHRTILFLPVVGLVALIILPIFF